MSREENSEEERQRAQAGHGYHLGVQYTAGRLSASSQIEFLHQQVEPRSNGKSGSNPRLAQAAGAVDGLQNAGDDGGGQYEPDQANAFEEPVEDLHYSSVTTCLVEIIGAKHVTLGGRSAESGKAGRVEFEIAGFDEGNAGEYTARKHGPAGPVLEKSQPR